MITGGQRSGKSTEAERLALSLSPNPVYMATAHIWDDEFRERVRKHQERRGAEWTNIEEEMHLSRHDVEGRVVLIDCCTLWATNFYFQLPKDAEDSHATNEGTDTHAVKEAEGVEACLSSLCAEFDRFTSQDATFIFVTNEIGLGGVSANAVQRKFTDLLGWFNQYVASKADEVYLMVSGIKVKIK